MASTQVRRSMRVFIYAQHLSGVGHLVRAQQIGLALAVRHRVAILDGGRPVTFPPALHRVTVPALVRRCGELTTLDGGLGTTEAFAQRHSRLLEYLHAERPDAILVEHFPFSKWELRGEIEAMLAAARRLNPAVIVIASLRDVSLRTSHESSQDYENTVLDLLHSNFDSLLVHADPAVCRLGDYFGAAGRIKLPVVHTGIVAGQIQPLDPDTVYSRVGADRYVVASAGGGMDRADLMTRVVVAWRLLESAGDIGRRKLLVFSGLDGYTAAIRRLLEGNPSVIPMGFDPDFKAWLLGSELSISCAGYNTCANLLAARTPALLLPNPAMSDQPERARLLTACGVAVTAPARITDKGLAALIVQNLGRPKTSHGVSIDGAWKSARHVEQLVSGLPGQ